MHRSILQSRLLPILLAAMLTVLGLWLVAALSSNGENLFHGAVISPQNGVYDLREVTDWPQAPIYLEPGSFYYPNVYLTPETAEATMPTPVSQYEEIRADYLSQRFVVLLPERDTVYTLTFTLSGRHAMRAYVNGSLAGQAGVPGTTKEETQVWENNMTFYGAASGGRMEVILHTAQFYHAKRGAALAQLTISSVGTKTDPFALQRIRGLLSMGVLLSAAALLLSIYLLLSRTKATVYFALACLSMVLRECLQSQAWVYFPFSGNRSFQLEYLSLVLLTVFLCLYLGQYAKGKFLRTTQYMALTGSILYGLCVLLLDSTIYTKLLGYYQVVLVLSIVPGIGGLFWKLRRPNREQAAALYGMAVFYLAATWDILMYSDLLGNLPNTPLSESAMLIFALAQTISLFLMNNRILSQAQEASQRLTAEKDALESLSQMKNEFLGNVSHELKTPLTVMSGYAQTTKRMIERPGSLDLHEVSRRMKLISSEAERLSLMVGQVLELTRMEEGRMVMERTPCYVDEMIHAAVETHYPMLNKNANRLDIRIEAGLRAVYADPARISQVVVNLISNAVRFTANGLITVSARREGSYITVCVEDTGCGISPEQLPHLFERYGGKQKSGGGSNTGTGLGLYICKYIVEQHQGSIGLESRLGQGTKVAFTLPVFENA